MISKDNSVLYWSITGVNFIAHRKQELFDSRRQFLELVHTDNFLKAGG